jgi:hypothetical protein
MEKKTALDQWQKLRNQLAYSDNTYSLLVKAIRSRSQKLGEGLPLSENEQKSVAWFLDQLLASGHCEKIWGHNSTTFMEDWKIIYGFQICNQKRKSSWNLSGGQHLKRYYGSIAMQGSFIC